MSSLYFGTIWLAGGHQPTSTFINYLEKRHVTCASIVATVKALDLNIRDIEASNKLLMQEIETLKQTLPALKKAG